MAIDPHAIIHSSAKIGKDVSIGPFSIVGEESQLDDGCIVDAHVVIGPNTVIGSNVRIHSWAAVGTDSQDRKYEGTRAYAKIGKGTVIREFVTINRGTEEGTTTIIGEDCFLLAYSHVAHNCVLGKGVVLANTATLAGYVEIDDYAVVGGLVAIHQFCRVGKYAIIGGCSKVVQDVLPYAMVDGHPATLRGVNKVGLESRDFPKDIQLALKGAFRILIRSGLSIPHAIEKIQKEGPDINELKELVSFIKKSERGICIKR